jgi:hypothetical protein
MPWAYRKSSTLKRAYRKYSSPGARGLALTMADIGGVRGYINSGKVNRMKLLRRDFFRGAAASVLGIVTARDQSQDELTESIVLQDELTESIVLQDDWPFVEGIDAVIVLDPDDVVSIQGDGTLTFDGLIWEVVKLWRWPHGGGLRLGLKCQTEGDQSLGGVRESWDKGAAR